MASCGLSTTLIVYSIYIYTYVYKHILLDKNASFSITATACLCQNPSASLVAQRVKTLGLWIKNLHEVTHVFFRCGPINRCPHINLSLLVNILQRLPGLRLLDPQSWTTHCHFGVAGSTGTDQGQTEPQLGFTQSGPCNALWGFPSSSIFSGKMSQPLKSGPAVLHVKFSRFVTQVLLWTSKSFNCKRMKNGVDWDARNDIRGP